MSQENHKNLKCILLCGGKGERLRPITDSIPKPLIPIKNKPILSYLIDHISKFGHEDLIVATGYQAEKIESFFSDAYKNLKIKLVNSGEADIIQRLKDCLEVAGDSDFMVFYGDTLSDIDISELIKFHQSHSGKATITVWPLQSQFGILEIDESNMVESFLEKPILDKWINIGYFYFDNSLKKEINKFNEFEEFLKYLIDKNELGAFKHTGLHITVNTQKELAEAENNISILEQVTYE